MLPWEVSGKLINDLQSRYGSCGSLSLCHGAGRHMKKLGLFVAILLSLGTSNASAALITYNFSGTFSHVLGAAPAGLIGGAFAGTLTYDTGAAASSLGANFINYVAGSASISFQRLGGGGQTNAGVGGISSAWDTSVATSLHGILSPADTFGAAGAGSFDPALAVFTHLNLRFVDSNGGVVDDPFGAPLSPPPSILSLSEIDVAEFTLIGFASVDGRLIVVASAAGDVSCLSRVQAECALQPASEPATLALLGLGLAGFAGARRRK